MNRTFHERYRQLNQSGSLKNSSSLLQLKEDLKRFITTIKDSDKELQYQMLLTPICYDIARLSEDATIAETHWKECIEIIKTANFVTEAILLYIGAYLNLGILYNKQSENKKTLKFLAEAETIYKKYKREACDTKNFRQVDNLYKNITMILGQVYQNLDIYPMSAKYNYISMKLAFESKSYKHHELAWQSANLSVFYVKSNNFKQARRYLAAANYFANEFKLVALPIHHQDVEMIFAYLNRYWAKYGIALLLESRKRLDGIVDMLTTDVNSIKLNDTDMPFLYDRLPLALYESEITADYVTTYKDANKIFLFSKRCLEKAKKYCTPNDEIEIYVDVMKDLTNIYDQITYFKKDGKHEFEMQNVRIKIYKELLDNLNTQTHLSICRQCWYDMAMCYSIQIILKSRLHGNDVQQLTADAIECFEKVIASSKGGSSFFKPNLTLDEKILCMNAHYKLGILHVRSLHLNVPGSMKMIMLYFNTFVDECTKDEELRNIFKCDIESARLEMMKALASGTLFNYECETNKRNT
ncbi:KIF-binding protein-like [Musca vetustissima]|uniref:KIF-binding protein-like n=1 Tax=Musca vetustissima TaxID=27455 RepID=UPI002AB5F13B|nr:KIF-binding protein-like [Musca vetustissima]